MPRSQALFDPLLPKGLQWYWKSDFVTSLPSETIDTHIAHIAAARRELSSMHLCRIVGAVRLVPPGAMAWSGRDAIWSMVIAAIDSDPSRADTLKTWARRYWKDVHRFNLSGAYVNFMMDDEGGERVQATYGDNYERLTRVGPSTIPRTCFV